MDETTIDWSCYQDIAGQLPSLQGYTQFCLLFNAPQRSAHEMETIVKLVENASITLASAFPWLSGQVINEGSSLGNSGIFKIAPYRQVGTGFDVLSKHYPELDYQDIVNRRAPATDLDGELISPKRDLSRMYNMANGGQPVMVLQVNFLNGGVIMTFAAAHNAMDMTGLGKFIELFGMACVGNDAIGTETEHANGERRHLVRLLGPEETELDHSMLVADIEDRVRQDKVDDEPSAGARWAYVHFSGKNLARLKEMAVVQDLHGTEQDKRSRVDWISTDDALSAFLWQRITLARLPHVSSGTNCILCRAVNARRFFCPPIPASYMGHMVSCTYNVIPVQSCTAYSLPTIAHKLREKLNQHNDHSIRSFLSFIHKHEDKTLINFAARMDLSRDVLVSSGAGLKVYHVNFGPMLGMPELVRRPRWSASEGVMFFMPKSRSGDVDVSICLREDDWHRLKEDETWNEFGEYIG